MDLLPRLLAALIVSAALVLGLRTLIALLTRLGSNPWPWKPQRWAWLLVAVIFLAGALDRTANPP